MAEAFLRTCLGCGKTLPKQAMIRVTCRASGEADIDQTGRAGGRGAYYCPDSACFEKGRKKLSRALRTTISQERLSELRARIEELTVKG